MDIELKAQNVCSQSDKFRRIVHFPCFRVEGIQKDTKILIIVISPFENDIAYFENKYAIRRSQKEASFLEHTNRILEKRLR